MNGKKNFFKTFKRGFKKAVKYFKAHLEKILYPIRLYTHIDADGLSAGAILGKALYREGIPFQITVLRQLEREEIIKIAERAHEFKNFSIFSDFGSGQYLVLQKMLKNDDLDLPFLILDHHLPQEISAKDQTQEIKQIWERTSPWHLNPYFFGVDGSMEISGSGMCYQFAKALNPKNVDLSPIALVGAVGDIQNKGENGNFLGANQEILKDAKSQGLITIINDLNFTSLKPLNEAIAYSNEIDLPGLTGDPNKTLKFLQTIGIIMETSDGQIKTLNDLSQDKKQRISSAIIEYASIKLNINPQDIIDKLIVNKYFLPEEQEYEDLQDLSEFSKLLNACGRTNSGALGIAIAMGNRTSSYDQAKSNQENYKQSLLRGFEWIHDEEKIQHGSHIQYFFGEEVITENIVGTICSGLIYDDSPILDLNKPIFGFALREEEKVYKVSGRASEIIVNKGINLSEAIRETNKRINLQVLGGGHPPAAGTKVPLKMAKKFINTMNTVIKEQLES